jgi:HSP20 family molecular chaperone IbpA
MSYCLSSPITPFESVLSQILFQDLWKTNKPCYTLQADLKETATHFIVDADVPGVTKSDIKVTVKPNRELTISYERVDPLVVRSTPSLTPNDQVKDEKQPTTTAVKSLYYAADLRYGKYTQTIMLPLTADTKDVSSTLENGVITLKFGKKLEEATEIHL